MTTEQQKVIDELRDEGFAVLIFTPEELKGASPSKVEDNSTEHIWNVIDILKEI